MRVDLEWERDCWLASVPEVPGCHTYGTSLPQTLRRVRHALHLFRADARDIRLDPHHILPSDLWDSLVAARDAAARAAAARDALRNAAFTLTDGGLSRRDAAVLLGISHQRVQQLLRDR